MKKFLTLSLLAVLALSSCSTVQSARDELARMPEADYQQLVVRVYDTAERGGVKLAGLLGENTEIALSVTNELRIAVESDALNVADVVRHIVDQYGTRLGLTEEQLDYVRDGAKVIDAAVGQIRLGIDGKLTDREKWLILALLGGLERGLS